MYMRNTTTRDIYAMDVDLPQWSIQFGEPDACWAAAITIVSTCSTTCYQGLALKIPWLRRPSVNRVPFR
jgi:hypothetical protein